MALSRTRTATRRSGDDYQDLVAARTMLIFLKNPSLYQWIKLEAREAGKLDDVVVLRADGTVEATPGEIFHRCSAGWRSVDLEELCCRRGIQGRKSVVDSRMVGFCRGS